MPQLYNGHQANQSCKNLEGAYYINPDSINSKEIKQGTQRMGFFHTPLYKGTNASNNKKLGRQDASISLIPQKKASKQAALADCFCTSLSQKGNIISCGPSQIARVV